MFVWDKTILSGKNLIVVFVILFWPGAFFLGSLLMINRVLPGVVNIFGFDMFLPEVG